MIKHVLFLIKGIATVATLFSILWLVRYAAYEHTVVTGSVLLLFIVYCTGREVFS